jgi:hypothetical protein
VPPVTVGAPNETFTLVLPAVPVAETLLGQVMVNGGVPDGGGEVTGGGFDGAVGDEHAAAASRTTAAAARPRARMMANRWGSRLCITSNF